MMRADDAVIRKEERPFALVLFGATGFTGRLTAVYLAQTVGMGVRWAIAGRDKHKLAHLKKELIGINPACEAVGELVADSHDLLSLLEMAEQTQVVLTTVGPFAKYGELLVQACVRRGTDYVDITGEPAFVRRLIERYDSEAQAQGVRIVPCCGFDSVPHDLGVLFTVMQLPDDVPLVVEGFLTGSGTLSGGTWHSAVEAMAEANWQEAWQGELLPAALATGRQVRELPPVMRQEPLVDGWVCSLPTIDPKIVLRSAAFLADYGPDFQYGHYVRVASLPKLVGGLTAVGGIFALAKIKPTRNMLLRWRKPGQGPDEQTRAEAHFKMTFVGRAGDLLVQTEVQGGDPGYGETAKMVAEAALCLVQDRAELPERTGVLTTAVAMGDLLIQRLRRAGISFELIADTEVVG
jgi:short subunit dehydrogenase-like uncharacterized protein